MPAWRRRGGTKGRKSTVRRTHPRRLRALVRLVQSAFVVSLLVGGLPASATPAAAKETHTVGCRLGGPTGEIKHVVYLQFDNVHFARDNPNVPSDLEQMPHLLNFLTSNGLLLTNHHTSLIAHTATGILTSLMGVYPERHGIPISNSFRYFNPDGSSTSTGAFGYWTAPLSASHPTPLMVDQRGLNAPAPWVPYTRADCDFGAVATANTILENNTTDIDQMFGAESPEHQEAKDHPAQATKDFVGIGIHCSRINFGCSGSSHALTDALPDEPGGYDGYQMLMGHKYVAEKFKNDKFMNPITAIDGTPIDGFPGFDGMTPSVSLGYAASMLEHGIPVVYAYLSDAHDNHTTGTGPFASGEPEYERQLREYDAGFQGFFERLARAGIDASNTLFTATVDEGDHFNGAGPKPPDCDGVSVTCSYALKGEVAGNLRGLIATQTGVTTPFAVHSDSAPNVYITGNPDQFSQATRDLERAAGVVRADNPFTGNEEVMNYLADRVEQGILHMNPSDTARIPTFTPFAKPWYFLTAPATPEPPNCDQPCISIDPRFIWIHGTIDETINHIWVGFAGPGVKQAGLDERTWSDNVDVRPTMMALTGLEDDYQHQGRVIYEAFADSSLPPNVRAERRLALRFGATLKRLNAPFGQLGSDSLAYATGGIKSATEEDERYHQVVDELTRVGAQRDRLANAMLEELQAVEFDGRPVRPTVMNRLIDQANELIEHLHELAAGDRGD